MLIDPTREDPSEFIEFRDGVPRGIDKGGRGKKTIKVLGLDRPGLNESRLRHLEHVRAFQMSLSALLLVRKPDRVQVAAIEMCRAILQEFVESKSEYTAMCRAVLV